MENEKLPPPWEESTPLRSVCVIVLSKDIITDSLVLLNFMLDSSGVKEPDSLRYETLLLSELMATLEIIPGVSKEDLTTEELNSLLPGTV